MSHTSINGEHIIEAKNLPLEAKKDWTMLPFGAIMWNAPERFLGRKEADNG